MKLLYNEKERRVGMKFTWKEKLQYTFIICFLMEFLMAYYNYFFHTDAFLHEAFVLACIEFVPAFLIGFLCELLFVSHIAKKVALFLHREHFSHRNVIRVNEFLIALGMMVVFSVYGALLHNGGEHINFVLLIIKDFIKNAIVGIPLFMFLVSPLARRMIRHEHAKEEDILDDEAKGVEVYEVSESSADESH